MASGFATTTYKMKLTCKRLDWLVETKALYNEVRSFYHVLLREHQELHELGSQAALRQLEKLSLTGKDGVEPERPLPFSGVPSYFRRSAANGAIGSFKTYLKNHKRWEGEQGDETAGLKPSPKAESRNRKALRRSEHEPQPAEGFQASPVFYKGMYKDFSEDSITLKLWTGSSWAWVRCRYRGRRMPEDVQRLSPTVVIKKNRAMLHIPIKQTVSDIRPVKARVEKGEPICAAAFTNTDSFAVCAVLEVDGRMRASRFIRGGTEYVHHSKRLLERIKSNRAVMGKHFDWTGSNKRHWAHLNRLGEYWAHKVSCEIVDFCVKNGAKTIAVMEPSCERMRQIAGRAGKYSPIYLSLKIRRFLIYKAWKEGIAVTYVRPGYITGVCSCCGTWLDDGQRKSRMKKQEGPAESVHIGQFLCPKGHRGDRNLNTAKNIGRNCLNKLGKRPA